MYQEDDVDSNDKVLSRSATKSYYSFGPLEVEKVESRSATKSYFVWAIRGREGRIAFGDTKSYFCSDH